MSEDFDFIWAFDRALIREFNVGWQEQFDFFDMESDKDAVATYCAMSV